MIGLLIVLFIVCFGSIVAVFLVSTKYFNAKQKEQIRSMLKKAEESHSTPQKPIKNLLKPLVGDEGVAKFLSSFSLIEKLDVLIEQAGQNSSSTKLLLTCLIASVVGYVGGQRFDFIVSHQITGLSVAALLFALPLLNLQRQRTKRFSQFEEQLPEALDFISRSMRAGHGFTIALEMLATDSPEPLGGAFRRISNDMQLGGSLHTCLARLLELFPLVDVRFFTSSVLLQQETGGNLGEILSKLATIIRERFRLKGAVKAASAHGKITGLVLVLMPVAVAGFLMMTSPEYLTEMAHDKTGKIMIYGAVIGQGVGWLVIKKITNIKV